MLKLLTTIAVLLWLVVGMVGTGFISAIPHDYMRQ